MEGLTHLNQQGQVRMVDVSGKEESRRIAVASGEIFMHEKTLELIKRNQIAKGDVLAVARLAGIQAAKRTFELIPLCHQIKLDVVNVDLEMDEQNHKVLARSQVICTDRTGAEMEALVAVSLALLTVYDMCKGVDRDMVMGDIKLLQKGGGRSGEYVRG